MSLLSLTSCLFFSDPKQSGDGGEAKDQASSESSAVDHDQAQIKRVGMASLQGITIPSDDDLIGFDESTGIAYIINSVAGDFCSRFIQERIESTFWSSLDTGKRLWRRSYKSQSASLAAIKAQNQWESTVKKGMKKTFATLDREYLRYSRVTFPFDYSAAGAMLCVIRNDHVILATIGKNVALYIRDDGATARMTFQHDVLNRKEVKRMLRKAPASWSERYLKDRMREYPLRAFGERELKNLGVLDAVPDFTTVEMDRNSFLLLCSGAVVDAMSDEEIGRFVVKQARLTNCDLDSIATELARKAIRASSDGASAILIYFN